MDSSLGKFCRECSLWLLCLLSHFDRRVTSHATFCIDRRLRLRNGLYQRNEDFVQVFAKIAIYFNDTPPIDVLLERFLSFFLVSFFLKIDDRRLFQVPSTVLAVPLLVLNTPCKTQFPKFRLHVYFVVLDTPAKKVFFFQVPSTNCVSILCVSVTQLLTKCFFQHKSFSGSFDVFGVRALRFLFVRR